MSNPLTFAYDVLGHPVPSRESVEARYAREKRESAIATDQPIGMIYSRGRGHHGYVDGGDTVGANGDTVYYPVFLAKPNEERLLDVIRELHTQNSILEGRLVRAKENLYRQPSDHATLSDCELNLFEKLRTTLGMNQAGLFEVMAVANVRVRRLQAELDKALDAASGAA